jgi:hypothetical protein
MSNMRRRATRRSEGGLSALRSIFAGGVTVAAAVLLLGLWANPPTWLRPAHSHMTSALHWIQGHWLNAVAITAWATVLLVAVTAAPFITRRQSRTGSDHAADRMNRERVVMLQQVRYKWITGVLEPSLATTPQMILKLKTHPGVIEPGQRVIQSADSPQNTFPEGKPISELFEQVGSALLILGRPGAGKTTLLLRLADGLLAQAENDPLKPIPVIFHLASWASAAKPLEEWLIEEMANNYDVPSGTAVEWLARGEIALLLDGLDEVRSGERTKCVEAINAYRRDHGLAPMAVCGRTEEIDQLAVRLRLHEAVEVQPPTDREIDRYFADLEAGGIHLADVRAALAADESLRELTCSPLMLRVVAFAYHDRPMPTPGKLDSTEERQAELWHAYIARMFEQRPLGADCTYTSAQAIRWLRWLARNLYNLDETEFHLDRLSGRWIPSNGQRSRRRPGPRPYDWTLTITNAAGQTVEWPPVDRISIRWVWWLGHGARLAGLPAVLCAVLGTAIATGLERGALTGMIAGLVCVMGTIICAIRLTSLSHQMWSGDPRPHPARYARYASIAGAFAASVLGTLYGSAFGLTFGPITGLVTGAGVALISGLLAWLNTGGDQFLMHAAVRAELVRADAAPARLTLFLDAMTERQLLLRSGDAYLFAHRLLRDFLAAGSLDGRVGEILHPIEGTSAR